MTSGLNKNRLPCVVLILLTYHGLILNDRRKFVGSFFEFTTLNSVLGNGSRFALTCRIVSNKIDARTILINAKVSY